MSSSWNGILNKLWNLFSSKIAIEGQQRPLLLEVASRESDDGYNSSRNHDLEIREIPIRDAARARRLIHAVRECSEIGRCNDIILADTFSSQDGDDQGFALGDTLDDGETLIDLEVKAALQHLFENELILSRGNLFAIAKRTIEYGDAFASLAIDKELRISRLLILPTWEMFRHEDRQGNLKSFEQRKSLYDDEPISYHPLSVVHWRHDRQTLYGTSLWWNAVADFERLERSIEDFSKISRATGLNPNVHVMPEGCSEDYKKAYKANYKKELENGPVSDFYVSCGGDVRKVANFNPDISSAIAAINQWRQRIVMRSPVPDYLLAVNLVGAKDIAMQPQLVYTRFICWFRQELTEGMMRVCNLQLALAGIPPERWHYRIVWPKLLVNPFNISGGMVESDESKNESMNNTDE
jgi:hypothetical protein